MAAKQELARFLIERLEGIEDRKPLIHHITNMVVMNETANATLCMGALPVMAHAREEVEEMATQAQALVVNMGTPYPELEESMILAGRAANRAGVPVILDPVGTGATTYRTSLALRLTEEINFAVVRGNAAEMAVLAGEKAEIRGVESLSVSGEAGYTAQGVASRLGCVAAVTGEVDTVVDGGRLARIGNGHPLLGRVTGTGCMATTAIAVMLAGGEPYFEATVAALAFFGLAGQRAAGSSGRLPGNLHVEIYNELYILSRYRKLKGLKIDME
ncbi:MAG: hydroxyethylthiazole kinase [Actinomycetota bacterium]|nr:hydroxyethylthiazole kinase [Actinomycetota bacterium]